MKSIGFSAFTVYAEDDYPDFRSSRWAGSGSRHVKRGREHRNGRSAGSGVSGAMLLRTRSKRRWRCLSRRSFAAPTGSRRCDKMNEQSTLGGRITGTRVGVDLLQAFLDASFNEEIAALACSIGKLKPAVR